MMPKRPSVLFIGRYWEERFLAGVAEYARKAGWMLHSGLRRSHQDLPPNWHGEGVIANTLGDPDLIQYVRERGVPAVATDRSGEVFGAPMIFNDETSIGRAAADHLVPLGFTHFAFVAPRNRLGSLRASGFEEAVTAAGRTCLRIAKEDLPDLLHGLPKPMAILITNDTHALDVMYEIESAGYQVPKDFALVGVDDDEITCTLCSVPLTSVNLDYEGRGYRCAEVLDLLMQGSRDFSGIIHWPIQGVTVRRSTDTIAIPHPAAAEALRFIREHYRKPIGLTELETHLGVSLRGIQDVFKHHVGRSLAQEIARLRLEAATQLLGTTKLKLEAIAQECGYSGRVHLARAIRRAKGLSPQAMRRTSRA
ncbi:MAG: substrate-binding domain-containing protein [Luteolibacter sp.]